MKSKPRSSLAIRDSSFIAIGTAFTAAITLCATTVRAPAQSVWGNALSFDGTNGYVRAGAVPLANASFTIEAWTRSVSSNTLDFIVGQGSSGTDVGLNFGFDQITGNTFVFGFYNDDLYATNSYTDNDWHHWAGTYNAATRARCLYCDGSLVASNVASANYQGSGPLLIGTLPWDTSGGAFHGLIDDVRVWNVALSQAQIAAQMTQPLSGKEPNLLAYWKFDEGSGTVAHDATTNHFDGSLVNGPTWVVSTVTVPLPFTYTTNIGTITITGYTGPGWDVTIPHTINGLSVTSIGASAFFDGTGLTFVAIPDSITSIGDDAFDACSGLTSVSIGNSVTNLGNYAFAGCTGLGSVAIPDSVIDIGDLAFLGCQSLTNVSIPKSVIHIGDIPFVDCFNLPAITVDPNNPAYSSVAGVLFDKNQTVLLEYPAGKAGSYTVPDGVTRIGNSAFGDCYNLTRVTISDGVTSIGGWAFDGCESLTGVAIPGSVTNIGQYAFGYCTSLASVTLPDSVTSIGNDAFDSCSSLTGVYFLGNAPHLGADVFYDDNATIYYFPGTTGLHPQMQTSGANFGVRTNRFGFTVTGASGLGVVVQACTNLARPNWSPVATLNFTGNAAYFGDSQWTHYPARFYRLASPTFGGRPVVLWNARVQTGDASFGVRTNRFGFTITGTPDIPIVVEACTNLVTGAWIPVQTCTVTNGSIYFGDPQWTNYAARFYRVRWP